MPHHEPPSTLLCTVVLFTVLALLAPAPVSATAGAQSTPEPVCTDETDSVAMDDVDALAFTDGFEDGSTANWTDGEVLPIGDEGRCSLGVVDGTNATLTRPVDASTEAVVGSLDLGTGGAVRLVGPNGSDGAVILRNSGRANDRGVELLVRNESGGIEAQRSLSTRSGRFFEFRLRWHPNGTVWLTLDSISSTAPAVREVDLDTATTPDQYHVELTADAYLDRIGVVRPTSDETAPEDGGDEYPGSGAQPGSNYDARPPADDSDGTDGSGGIGFIMLLFGLPGALAPYKVARFGEQLDAIGSKTRSRDVEPADWNVLLTRVVGIGMTLVGVLFLLDAMV